MVPPGMYEAITQPFQPDCLVNEDRKAGEPRTQQRQGSMKRAEAEIA